MARHDLKTECFWLKLFVKILTNGTVITAVYTAACRFVCSRADKYMPTVIIGLVMNNETVVIVGYRARLNLEFESENRLKKLRKDTWRICLEPEFQDKYREF
jgi:hypothetical protein